MAPSLKDFDVEFTDKDVEDYEKERLARLEKFSKDAPVMCEYKVRLPKLNPDGSLASEERDRDQQEEAGTAEAWGGEAKKVGKK